ncbi:MAG: ABC transporter permease [Armatimonadetes bacterium]|nr:ABC transporter permease [Armatimonadota bacterium]
MNYRRLLAVARTESIHNLRDVRSLFVIVVLPVVLLLLYGYGINYDLRNVPFAVQDLERTELSRSLIQHLVSSGYFQLRQVIHDQRQIAESLDRAAVVFVLVIPPDMGRRLGAGRPAKVQVLVDGADTTRASVAVGYIEGALLAFSGKLGAEYLARQGLSAAGGLDVRPVVLYNADLKSVRFIVPGLMAILLTLLSGLLTSTCIVREREWGSFETLVTSPALPPEILIGKILPYVVIAFADTLLSIGAGALIFGVVPVGSRLLLLFTSFLYLLASLAIGIFFSTIMRTQRLAILTTTLVTLVPTIQLSGFAFPIRSQPLVLQVISNFIPATHYLIIIRSLYLKGADLLVLWPRVLALLVFTVVLVTVAARRFRKQL